MLPVDSLKLLKQLADDAAPGRRIVTAPAEPPHVYYVVQPDGGLVRTTAVVRPSDHRAADLSSLVAWAKKQAAAVPCIWFSRVGVVAGPVPGSDAHDRCRLDLEPSPHLALLMTWEKAGRATVQQAALVILLRTTFAGCYPAFPKLLENVRSVKTSKAADVNSQIGHGKVSLGKSVIAEMSGLGGIPEEVTFRVPVFAAAAVRCYADVRVAIDPDPNTESFTLVVIPGQIEEAFATGEAWLADRLAALVGEAKIPVYHGAAR